jgi:ATP dependent DNA ligase domain
MSKAFPDQANVSPVERSNAFERGNASIRFYVSRRDGLPPIFSRTSILVQPKIDVHLRCFDLLFLNGRDLRPLPLVERNRKLRKLLRRKRSRILYLDHVENDGRLLFDQIVKMDLEGMVCKRKSSPYRATEKPSPYWIKVKNPRYSQIEGREDLFEKPLR